MSTPLSCTRVAPSGSGPIRLIQKIRGGEGGEGEVWETSESRLVAKIWKKTRPAQSETLRKLQAMINGGPPKTPPGIRVAWPEALLIDDRGANIGFVMQKAENCKSLFGIYHPRERTRFAPGVTWQFQHDVIRRVAAAVAAVHRIGAVVGDLNPKNVLVGPNRELIMIDVDSWQIPDPSNPARPFLCKVGMPDFMAPELIGQDLHSIKRDASSDTFVLAVLAFQSIFFYHPFLGKWRAAGEQPEMGELLRRGNNVFDSAGSMLVPDDVMPLALAHPRVLDLFRITFGAGCGNPAMRPTASQWRDALDEATESLFSCSVHAHHFVLPHWKECYWCSRRANQLDVFPHSDSSHRVIPPLEQRVVQFTQSGRDDIVATYWRKYTWLQQFFATRPELSEIQAAIDRYKLLEQWRQTIATRPTDFWLPLNSWPTILDSTPLARRQQFHGESIQTYLDRLRGLRTQIASTVRAIQLWDSETDFDKRSNVVSDRVLSALNQVLGDLPNLAPEFGPLNAKQREVTNWMREFRNMQRMLQKAKELHLAGEEDEAKELLEPLTQSWDSYPSFSDLQVELDKRRLPWDSKELRREIRDCIQQRRFVTAKTKLSLLPLTALRGPRKIVEESLAAANALVGNGTSMLTVDRIADAHDCLHKSLRVCADNWEAHLMLVRAALQKQVRSAMNHVVPTPTQNGSLLRSNSSPENRRSRISRTAALCCLGIIFAILIGFMWWWLQ